MNRKPLGLEAALNQSLNISAVWLREGQAGRLTGVRLGTVTEDGPAGGGSHQLKGSDRRESKKVSQAKSTVNKSRHLEAGNNFWKYCQVRREWQVYSSQDWTQII